MKKLILGFGIFFCLCFGVIAYKFRENTNEYKSVELTNVSVQTVNETVSCNGSLMLKNTETYKCSVPAEIIYVAVEVGDEVSKGDFLFSYRVLSSEELMNYSKDIALSEAQTVFETVTDNDTEDTILSAAAYYAEHGCLPPEFENYYLGTDGQKTEEKSEYRPVYSEFDGTVDAVSVTVGEFVSGMLGAVTVSDRSALVAKVGIPEDSIYSVKLGQYALITSGGSGGRQFSSKIIEISNEARTEGSLLGSGETVVDCVLDIDTDTAVLLPGLSVRADIFINTWKDATVIPYSALCNDEEGYYVWVWDEGRIFRRDIAPEYRYSKGVVVTTGFDADELLVKDPGDELYDGMAVSVLGAGE